MLTVLETQFMKQMPNEVRHLSENVEKQTKALEELTKALGKQEPVTVSYAVKGVDGLYVTREEIIELKCEVQAVIRKAQCREVNCEIIDQLDEVHKMLCHLDNAITDLIGD